MKWRIKYFKKIEDVVEFLNGEQISRADVVDIKKCSFQGYELWYVEGGKTNGKEITV